MSKVQGKSTYDPTPNLTNIGKGRKRGVPNKTTKLLKDAILKAAEATGEDQKGKDGLVGYCTYLAKDEPKAEAADRTGDGPAGPSAAELPERSRPTCGYRS